MDSKKYSKLKQQSINHSPLSLVDSLGFNEALHTACNMLNNEEWDESLQEYATNLLEELRRKYPENLIFIKT